MSNEKINSVSGASIWQKFSISGSTFLLIVLLLVLVAIKFYLNRYITHYSIDGGFYFDVARHVHDGLGLKSQISLYHKGYTYFPHPTDIYPVWPIVLGYTSRITSLPLMAVWLPTFFYLFSLILAYVWANQIYTERLFANFPNLKSGHFLVIFLGLNSSYFLFTSRPYTEGLAFVLLFAFLMRSHSLLKSPRMQHGVEIGVWLALLVLTRSQWIIVVIAMMMTFLIALFSKQKRYTYLGMFLLSLTSMILMLLPFWFYVNSFSEEAHWFNFLHFSSRPNSLLSIPSFAIGHLSFAEFVLDKLSGLIVAFDYNRRGYVSIFHEYIYLIPLAFIVLLASLRKLTLQKIKCFVKAFGQHFRLELCLPVLIAIGAFSLVHLLHNEYISEWYFTRRHAIPVVFLVFFSFIYLARQSVGRLNMILFAVLFSGTLLGLVRNISIARAQQYETTLEVERNNLAEWLEEERKSAGRTALTIAISDNEGQRLVWRTRKISYHWVFFGATTLADYEMLFDDLACDYLVLRDMHDGADYPLPDDIERVVEDFEYFDIYRVNRMPDVGAGSQFQLRY